MLSLFQCVCVCKCECRSVSVEVSVFKGFSGRTLRNAFGKKIIDIVGVCMCVYAWMDISVCMCVYEVLMRSCGGNNDLVEGSVGETIGSARQLVSLQTQSEFSATELRPGVRCIIDIVGVCTCVCLYAWMDISVCMCAHEVLWGE